jgi:hypothetical protein
VRSTESKKSNPAGWLSFQHQRARGPTQATRQQTRARQAKAVHATATNQSIKNPNILRPVELCLKSYGYE